MDTCGYMSSIHFTTLYNVDCTYSHIFTYSVHASTQAKLYMHFTGVTCTCIQVQLLVYTCTCVHHMKNVYTIVARKVVYSVMRGRNRESESVKTAYTHVGHIPAYPLSYSQKSVNRRFQCMKS